MFSLSTTVASPLLARARNMLRLSIPDAKHAGALLHPSFHFVQSGCHSRSRITRYITSLRSKYTKCSRPRLAVARKSSQHAPAFDSRRKARRCFASPLLSLRSVGLPGIEPGPHAPHACTLPLCYSPNGERITHDCVISERNEWL